MALLRSTTVLAAALLAAMVIFGSRGAIDTAGDDPNAAALPAMPAWAQSCRSREPRHDRELLRTCARVSGRVLAVKRELSRTGPPDVHVALIARFHLFVVKLDAHHRRPRLGSTVTVIGPLVRARNGLREVDALQVTP
jgi:hypothetical protein